MKRSAILVSSLGLALAFGPCLAQSTAELQKKLEDLTKRVEGLERRLGASAAAVPPAPVAPPAAADSPSTGGREAAIALYKEVDLLLAAGKLEQAKSELAAWDVKYANTPDAGWTSGLNREVAVVGKPVPTDWSIEKWFQGQSEIKLDGQRPTLLVFWEAWCPHCREEVPKMEHLRAQYKSKGLQVLGVTRITQTATEESVKAFLAESGVSYPMAKETGALAEYFAVQGIPAAALVKDGKIVWRGHPIRLTDELMDVWF